MPPSFENFPEHTPEINEGVAAAISTLSGAPSDSNRIALYRALKHGWLFLGAAEKPAEWNSPSPITLKQATSVTLLTSSAPDRGQVLLVFTSPDKVSERNKQAYSFAMASLSALELVVTQDFNALVIDPNGPWAGVPKEDVQKILQGVW